MNDPYERYPDPTQIQHSIGQTGQLTINNVSGEVRLRGIDGGEATVRIRSESGRSEWLPVTVRKGDGALTIDVEKHGSFAMFGTWFGSHDGIEFDVSVPRAARVSINTVSADIRAAALTGEQAYKTVSGDLLIESTGGKVRAVTVSGDLNVDAQSPLELTANTTSGDVLVRGATVDRFDAHTVSGDIRLDGSLAAGNVHTVETVSGDFTVNSPSGVTVDVKRSMDLRHGGSRGFIAGDGAAQVHFRTLSGDCDVRGGYETDGGGRDRQRKHGKHDRFERQLERRIERQVRSHLRGRSSDEISFPGASDYSEPAVATTRQAVDQLEVLRALERGEIDVEEATRRLQEA